MATGWQHGFIVAIVTTSMVAALDNGLAMVPPMGWLAWQRYRCNTNCTIYHDNCLTEQLIKRMADKIVADGYKDAGYEYVNVDDCWMGPTRDQEGRLQPDPDRFPSGIKALADYVHSKGLKFGLYEAVGIKTCQGLPGSEYYMKMDADTFASWGVDSLKFDGCYFDAKLSIYGYPTMGLFLNRTGRQILYTCEWPLHDFSAGIKPDFAMIRKTCNTWRNYHDMQDDWQTILDVISFFQKNQGDFQSFAGPGGWNDPDMLVIGNFGLSYDQERVQMAMWSIFAAPLYMSVDLYNIRQQSKDLLQNKRLIAINQDRLGIAGKMVLQEKQKWATIQVWTRPISPVGSFAVAILNLFHGSSPQPFYYSLEKIGLHSSRGYNITETFDGKFIGTFYPKHQLTGNVNPSGVYMVTAKIL